jgi:uncharacterized protein
MAMNIRYLILAVTSRCNLKCRYCYLAAQRVGDDMSDVVLDQSLNLIRDNDTPCHIQITGGEPTLVPEKIARIAKLSRLLPIKPQLAIQTNATLLTRELGQLFKEYKFQIGISLDGPHAIQKSQRGMASETLRGLKLLESMNIPFRVTTVVTSANVLYLDKLVLLLASFSNSRGIGIDLLVNKGRASADDLQSATMEELQKGINRLMTTLTMINRHRAIPLQLRELDLLNCGDTDRPFCRVVTGQSLAIRWDGSLFPCGQTMGDSFFHMGTVTKPQRVKEGVLSEIKLQSKRCNSCSIARKCPGDCPSRLHYNSEDRDPRICTMYKTLAGFRADKK